VSRRLSEEEAAAVLVTATPIPSGRPGRRVRTSFSGAAPSGSSRDVEIETPTLVVFLSTTCDGCRDLAGLVRTGAPHLAVLGVLRAPGFGLPDAAVDAFVGGGGDWLLGDDPFTACDVHAAPYFCLLDGAGTVVVEGVAFGASHVADHAQRALAGDPRPDAVRLRPEPT
jgi:hypothetical protein